MSLDLNNGYNTINQKISATKAYGELKSQYNETQRKSGQTFEKAKNTVSNGLNQVTGQKKTYQRQVKNQFEQLLDINNLTGGKGSNSIRYIKKLLLKTVKNIEPRLRELVLEESFNAIGCDQNQSFTAQTVYIKVKSTDIANLLKKDPNTNPGKVLYEKQTNLAPPQTYPYPMNRELYRRVQNQISPYTNDTGGVPYNGRSGQPLFNITCVPTNNNGETGPWFKVDLISRGSAFRVNEFMADYFSTISLVQYPNIMAGIMEALTGCISINANVGLQQAEDATKFEIILQRILGLCFDNRTEIDVSGVAKIAELDGVDNSFFEFTDIDLRNIELRIDNLKKGVIQFEECDFVDLPVNTQSIIDNLNNLLFVEGDDEISQADKLTETLINNPQWQNLALRANIDVAVNVNFVKLIVQGLVSALISPKILLPIMIMLKVLGNNFVDAVNSYMDFVKKFSKFAINLISKIGAIFVQELFNLIKKDIVNLIQQVIQDVAKEKASKKITMILKLIQLLLILAQLISDWRKCKSVIDELLQLLTVATTGWGGEIPLPLLFASRILDGYSESRAFIGTIEELQKLGIPTGPLPDGSPNLDVLSKFAQMKAMAKEDAENGKVQVVVGPLSITPAGLTVPASSFGKKF
jgi:hypothetical protein